MPNIAQRFAHHPFAVGLSIGVLLTGLSPTFSRIALAGPPCSVADITEIGGTPEAPGSPDGQLTVDDFILFTSLFSDSVGCPGTAPCNLADVCGVGGLPSSSDGELTADDMITFANAFSDGCDPFFNENNAFLQSVGWTEGDAAREWIGNTCFGGYVNTSHDVLGLGQDPTVRASWTGSTGVAGSGSPFGYVIHGTWEFTNIPAEAVASSGCNSLRIGLVFLTLSTELGSGSFGGVWFACDNQVRVVPIVAMTIQGPAADMLESMRESFGNPCPDCRSYVEVCANWDAQAQLDWDALKLSWDQQFTETQATQITGFFVCATGAIIGCGLTWWIPLLGEAVCTVTVGCTITALGCEARSIAFAASRRAAYKRCICMQAEARTVGLQPPVCPAPAYPSCP